MILVFLFYFFLLLEWKTFRFLIKWRLAAINLGYSKVFSSQYSSIYSTGFLWRPKKIWAGNTIQCPMGHFYIGIHNNKNCTVLQVSGLAVILILIIILGKNRAKWSLFHVWWSWGWRQSISETFLHRTTL